MGYAINTGGTATVNNIISTGVITAGSRHRFTDRDINAVTANTGLIEATGADFAIAAAGTADITNTGKIQALVAPPFLLTPLSSTIASAAKSQEALAAFAIGAQTVNVTANAGRIEATGANSAAIFATNVTVNNLSGGTISGGELGIMAGTADVTNATGATISGGHRIGYRCRRLRHGKKCGHDQRRNELGEF